MSMVVSTDRFNRVLFWNQEINLFNERIAGIYISTLINFIQGHQQNMFHSNIIPFLYVNIPLWFMI
jgi:hypothetical protein